MDRRLVGLGVPDHMLDIGAEHISEVLLDPCVAAACLSPQGCRVLHDDCASAGVDDVLPPEIVQDPSGVAPADTQERGELLMRERGHPIVGSLHPADGLAARRSIEWTALHAIRCRSCATKQSA